MKYNRLGRTELMVSELCLGTMTWGSQNTEAEGHAQIDLALESGLNFMDTAELYAVPPRAETHGATETIIGNWFRKAGKRDQWILATKIGGGGSRHIRGGARADGKSIAIALDESLKRLQTDYVDLYQIHWASRGSYNFDHGWTYAPHTQDTADVLANLLDVLEGLDRAVKAGKIRHVGVSNETAWGLAQYLRRAEQHGLPRMVSIQNEFNLIRRQFELDLAELSHHEAVGLLAYSPLAAGLLTGKYADGTIPAGSRAEYQKGLWRMNDHSTPVVDHYLALARKHGLDPAQMAIAYCRSRPFMTSVIIGATSIGQLRIDIGAADLTLSDAVIADIDAVHRRYPRPI